MWGLFEWFLSISNWSVYIFFLEVLLIYLLVLIQYFCFLIHTFLLYNSLPSLFSCYFFPVFSVGYLIYIILSFIFMDMNI